MKRREIALLLPLLLLGCGVDDGSHPPFQFFDDVRVWATTASAVSVYSNAYEVLAVADGHLAFDDPRCPEVDDDGDTLTISGDCTDDSGRKWTGSAELTRDGTDVTVTFDDLNGVDGDFARQQVGEESYEFQAELTIGGVTEITYIGSVKGTYDSPTLWEGSGHFERHGAFAPHGAIDAVTENELVDDSLCVGQPASGHTTLSAAGDVAVITYDGASDCDEQKNAELSVNDVDQGLIDGISCSFRRGHTAGSFAALALAVLMLGRRRAAQ